METAVLMPIKAFHAAKGRLAGWLPDDDRRRLAHFMAERVARAASPFALFVACDDDDVAAWAESIGAKVLWGPGLGLNGAIDQGIDMMAGKGVEHVIVCHGDLPLADSFAPLVRAGAITLVPDRRHDGTNVLARPCSVRLSASYGAGSFRQHLDAALATGLPVTVRDDRRLSIDIDTIDDCRHPLVAPLVRPFFGGVVPA
ncbi:MAG: hypothetical protein ABIO83_10860 [Ilumatobacteraceae bacterium]